MKVWLVHAYDSVSTFEIVLFKTKEAAILYGTETLEDLNGFMKVRVIEDYAGRKGEIHIVTEIDAEEFFPGETEVVIKEETVR